ncbi:MAG TPA: response regulator, partial [Opitutus sp.]|nr:response regulator [Opitutus sp.]
VRDGEAAVAEYRKHFGTASAYDAVILDLTVAGGMGGRDALEQLSQLDPEVKAIVSSGYSNDQVLSNYRDYGFCGIVAKPYETAALAAVLNQLL